MKSMVEITFEGPCDGRLQEILEWVDARSSSRQVKVAAHISSCARCASFVESSQHERLAIRESPSFDRRHNAPRTDPLRGIDRWLTDRFQVRSDQELAKAITAVARAVMRRNADYAERVVSSNGLASTQDVSGALAKLVEHTKTQTRTLSHTTRGLSSRVNGQRSAIVVARILRNTKLQFSREELARKLALYSTAVSSRCSLAWILLGNIAWFSGPDNEVPVNFERALETSANSHEYALALTNQSIFAIDSGQIAESFRLSTASLNAAPTLLGYMNRMIWCRFFGKDAEAEQLLSTLKLCSDASAVAHLLRPASIRRQADSLAGTYDMSQRRKTQVVQRLLLSLAVFKLETHQTIDQVKET